MSTLSFEDSIINLISSNVKTAVVAIGMRFWREDGIKSDGLNVICEDVRSFRMVSTNECSYQFGQLIKVEVVEEIFRAFVSGECRIALTSSTRCGY